jgi:DNA modification methylase
MLDIYFPESSLIYDPFIGIGTTARACVKAKRFFIGSEIVEEIFEEANKNLEIK